MRANRGYFIKDKFLNLLDSIKQDWLVHNILPSVDSIYILSKGLKLETWSMENLLVLLAFAYAKREEIITWMEEKDKIIELDWIYFKVCEIENKRNRKSFELGSGVGNEQQHFSCFVFEVKSPFLDIHIYAKDNFTVEYSISMESPLNSERYGKN